MLLTFFFVLSLLTDYRALSELLRSSAIAGVVNTGVFLAALSCVCIQRVLRHGVGAAENTDAG